MLKHKTAKAVAPTTEVVATVLKLLLMFEKDFSCSKKRIVYLAFCNERLI